MELKEIEALGKVFKFNPDIDACLQRGIIDPYMLSDNNNEWVILEDFVFWSARAQKMIIAPKWSTTDLASIPKGMRWLISVNERHRIPAIAHDILYDLNTYKNLNGIDRKTADGILLDFCKVYNVSTWKRIVIYSAVRAGGYFAWKSHSDFFYIPKEHQEWYIEKFPRLKLELLKETHTELII